MKTEVYKCSKCHKNRVQREGEWCSCCSYQSQVDWMLEEEPDYQDWEFAHCPECGSSFDSCGICRNQNCGNSPDVGKDWY